MKAWTQTIEPGPALITLFLILFVSQTVFAAPTSPEEQSTEIEYYPVADATGCYYNFQHYDEGDRIITNEPCLNCTCHNRMLMCYLRVCPFTKAIGADCIVEKRSDQCCPVITCPEVPVQLLTSTVPSTAVGHLNEYGCSIEGLFYSDGARVPSNPNNPCELCYCIRNKTACVMQECTLNVQGCRPVYQEGVCCPVRYDCDHPDYIETTPKLLLTTTTSTTTTTTLAPTTTVAPSDCMFNGDLYADGALVKKDIPCEQCYCMRGDIVCAVQECGPTPLDKVNCTALAPADGQCCPDTYDCENLIEEELTTITSYEAPTTQAIEPTQEDHIVFKEEEEHEGQEVTTEQAIPIEHGVNLEDRHKQPEEEQESTENQEDTVTEHPETATGTTPLETITSRVTDAIDAITSRFTQAVESITSRITDTEPTVTETAKEGQPQELPFPTHPGEKEYPETIDTDKESSTEKTSEDHVSPDDKEDEITEISTGEQTTVSELLESSQKDIPKAPISTATEITTETEKDQTTVSESGQTDIPNAPISTATETVTEMVKEQTIKYESEHEVTTTGEHIDVENEPTNTELPLNENVEIKDTEDTKESNTELPVTEDLPAVTDTEQALEPSSTESKTRAPEHKISKESTTTLPVSKEEFTSIPEQISTEVNIHTEAPTSVTEEKLPEYESSTDVVTSHEMPVSENITTKMPTSETDLPQSITDATHVAPTSELASTESVVKSDADIPETDVTETMRPDTFEPEQSSTEHISEPIVPETGTGSDEKDTTIMPVSEGELTVVTSKPDQIATEAVGSSQITESEIVQEHITEISNVSPSETITPNIIQEAITEVSGTSVTEPESITQPDQSPTQGTRLPETNENKSDISKEHITELPETEQELQPATDISEHILATGTEQVSTDAVPQSEQHITELPETEQELQPATDKSESTPTTETEQVPTGAVSHSEQHSTELPETEQELQSATEKFDSTTASDTEQVSTVAVSQSKQPITVLPEIEKELQPATDKSESIPSTGTEQVSTEALPQSEQYSTELPESEQKLHPATDISESIPATETEQVSTDVVPQSEQHITELPETEPEIHPATDIPEVIPATGTDQISTNAVPELEQHNTELPENEQEPQLTTDKSEFIPATGTEQISSDAVPESEVTVSEVLISEKTTEKESDFHITVPEQSVTETGISSSSTLKPIEEQKPETENEIFAPVTESNIQLTESVTFPFQRTVQPGLTGDDQQIDYSTIPSKDKFEHETTEKSEPETEIPIRLDTTQEVESETELSKSTEEYQPTLSPSKHVTLDETPSVTESIVSKEKCNGESCVTTLVDDLATEKSTQESPKKEGADKPLIVETTPAVEITIDEHTTTANILDLVPTGPSIEETNKILDETVPEIIITTFAPEAHTESSKITQSHVSQTESTTEEEIVVVTEVPTKKTEKPESMDHIAETMSPTVTPKDEDETSSKDKQTDFSETSPASDQTEVPEPVIITESTTKKERISPEGTSAPEVIVSSKVTPSIDEQKIISTVTEQETTVSTTPEYVKPDDNEITHPETERPKDEHISTEITTETVSETDKTPVSKYQEKVTESNFIPETPVESLQTTVKEELAELTTESNAIPEIATESIKETNEIPEGPISTSDEAMLVTTDMTMVTKETSHPSDEESSGQEPNLDTSNEIEGSGESSEAPEDIEQHITESEPITQKPEQGGEKASYTFSTPEVTSKAPEHTLETESTEEPKEGSTSSTSDTSVENKDTQIYEQTTEYALETSTAEIEHGIPGEGNCLVDGRTYKNNTSVPPINRCQTSCKCISSILQCESIDCTPPPINAQNCLPVFQGPESCCPTYSCTPIETTTQIQGESSTEETVLPQKESDEDKTDLSNVQTTGKDTEEITTDVTTGLIQTTERVLTVKPEIVSPEVTEEQSHTLATETPTLDKETHSLPDEDEVQKTVKPGLIDHEITEAPIVKESCTKESCTKPGQPEGATEVVGSEIQKAVTAPAISETQETTEINNGPKEYSTQASEEPQTPEVTLPELPEVTMETVSETETESEKTTLKPEDFTSKSSDLSSKTTPTSEIVTLGMEEASEKPAVTEITVTVSSNDQGAFTQGSQSEVTGENELPEKQSTESSSKFASVDTTTLPFNEPTNKPEEIATTLVSGEETKPENMTTTLLSKETTKSTEVNTPETSTSDQQLKDTKETTKPEEIHTEPQPDHGVTSAPEYDSQEPLTTEEIGLSVSDKEGSTEKSEEMSPPSVETHVAETARPVDSDSHITEPASDTGLEEQENETVTEHKVTESLPSEQTTEAIAQEPIHKTGTTQTPATEISEEKEQRPSGQPDTIGQEPIHVTEISEEETAATPLSVHTTSMPSQTVTEPVSTKSDTDKSIDEKETQTFAPEIEKVTHIGTGELGETTSLPIDETYTIKSEMEPEESTENRIKESQPDINIQETDQIDKETPEITSAEPESSKTEAELVPQAESHTTAVPLEATKSEDLKPNEITTQSNEEISQPEGTHQPEEEIIPGGEETTLPNAYVTKTEESGTGGFESTTKLQETPKETSTEHSKLSTEVFETSEDLEKTEYTTVPAVSEIEQQKENEISVSPSVEISLTTAQPDVEKSTEEVSYTSPFLSTQGPPEQVNISLPDRSGELFTSGTTIPDVVTKASVENELSTSVPLSQEQSTSAVITSLPSFSTSIAPAPIPGEQMPELPDYQQPDVEYDEEDQNSFGPGTCRYGGKVYVSAQQIPRDDPCDFCFCFRSDIICLQQSCPPPIPRCHEEPIRGFCCPRYECPVSMATSVNITTSTTTTTTTLPPHFLSHAYKGRAQKTGCQIKGQAYKVGDVIQSASGPCLHCTCGGDGQMKCDPKPCSPEPMLRQMIEAAASRKRR